MACVSEISGCYVSASIPKVLMLPVASRQLSKQGTPNKDNSRQHRDVLYASAVSSSCGGKLHNVVSRNNGEADFGDLTLPPVPGRQHITIQTDLYLEELCDVIDEADESCQTDPFLDRPASPLFVPAKIGIDVGTQIWTGDLFDFDREVQPLLESMVSQTIEQSLIEIVADQELVALQEQQKEYELRRNTELVDRLRLEEQERRLLEERQKRLKEQEEAVRLEEDTAQKVAACVYAQNYLSDLLPKVYKRLESQGYFATQVPEIQHVEEDFWPWLMQEVDSEITTLETSCCLLDSLIDDAVQNVTEYAVIKQVTPDLYPERIEETTAEQELLEPEDENMDLPEVDQD